MPSEPARDRESRVIIASGRVDFRRCPICLIPANGAPLTEEHVPPEGIGGSVLTMTCARCNNTYGSEFERHLVDWYADAVNVHWSSDSIRGNRKTPRVLIRQTSDGSPLLMLDRGRVDSAVVDMLAGRAGDRFSMRATIPPPRRVTIAVLKSAYLAVCVLTRSIPQGERSDNVRELLVAARDDPDGLAWPHEQEVFGPLGYAKLHREPSAGAAYLILDPRGDEPEMAINMGNVLVASWPIDPWGGFTASWLAEDGSEFSRPATAQEIWDGLPATN